ncbi:MULTISPECIES: YigZ family protein [Lactiplantibacillus]|uniref:YigZ family protein n=1 Tax=Lactiplantibacillus pentosus TaxID=1589 RepID=A0AAW8WIV5_LACPE|nr:MULTISPECIES: YigZ family protein [Lactiplantibacillus]MBU7461410.1 YigZ family protein [Lactiplantibacillus pentosus]MBU7475810.1 YigZ family protein [Lactiplantibacillus pentosus]MBU7484182.1 YigZ family protein [Lactiplantibacillus sp. 30.2.29]MBU7487381.1 YigZ family protein [Lactiplantibacillus pentosus]MBU7500408.1 YigZ family protein [Lactiplantibacillus pentosus]
MTKPYYTITQDTVFEQTIKKSRFIAHLYRITSEEDAQAKIAAVRAANPKANHNCFAYMLGDDDHIQRMSDDGEPSGTAGSPILEVLKANDVHDVLAIVTRYFGGIKLGAGGLIRAYNGTPAAAIEACGKVERVLQMRLAIALDYRNVDALNYYLQQNQLVILNTDYGVQVTQTIAVSAAELAAVQTAITNLLSGQVTFTEQGEQFAEVPVSQD